MKPIFSAGIAGIFLIASSMTHAQDVEQEMDAKQSACAIKTLDTIIKTEVEQLRQLGQGPDDNIENLYFDNEESRAAILTAIQTGQYQSELDKVRQLSQSTQDTAEILFNRVLTNCANPSHQDEDPTSPSILDSYNDLVSNMVQESHEEISIVKMLRDTGRDMIAKGAKPADMDSPILLFD